MKRRNLDIIPKWENSSDDGERYGDCISAVFEKKIIKKYLKL